MSDIAHGMAADIIMIDQAVSRDSALLHRAPQGIVIVHGSSPFKVLFLLLPYIPEVNILYKVNGWSCLYTMSGKGP